MEDEVMSKEKDGRKQLPLEIIEEILVRLPVKSLLRFGCVCKSWLSLIRNLHFIRAHLRRSIENSSKLILASRHNLHLLDFFESDDEPTTGEFDLPFDYYGGSMRLMGSCNGLICVSDQATSTKIIAYVWNPATSEHVKLSYEPPKIPNIPHFMPTGLGFGYTPATDEYKVVIFVDYFRIASYLERIYHRTDVIVCTLGTKSWRCIPNVPYFVSYSQAAELNGALHWLAVEGEDKNDSIICFDLLNEEFRELQLPHFRDGSVSINIAVVGGCLSVFGHFFLEDYLEMWVMSDYGNEQSWTKQFSDRGLKLFGDFSHMHPLGFTRNGKILFEKRKSNLGLYDPVKKSIRNLLVHGKPDVLEAFSYVESLVSLGVGDDEG